MSPHGTLGMIIDINVAEFGAATAAQNSSTLARDDLSSEEEDSSSSSILSTLVIADSDLSHLMTFE